jgi:hypothetical protein
MPWIVRFEDEFEREFAAFETAVQDELLAGAQLLRQYGPRLGRPHCDTLKGARHANLKELRFDAAGGVWRVAFAFDPNRHAILLVAGDKSGVSQDRFYQRLIAQAHRRYTAHLQRLKMAASRGR